MTYDPANGYPDLATIRSWTGVPATLISDEQLAFVAGAEQTEQDLLLMPRDDASSLPDPLYQSFLRRVARHLAAKNVPLGFISADAEFGVARLSKWDAEVSRLELPYMAPVLG